MSNRVLVDTDIFIDIGREISQAIEYLQQLEAGAKVVVSTVTQMELIVGCQNKSELRKVERFLKRYEIIRINESISETAVELLSSAESRRGLNDTLRDMCTIESDVLQKVFSAMRLGLGRFEG